MLPLRRRRRRVTVSQPVGIDYCLEHHGTRNEDDAYEDVAGELGCDWAEEPDDDGKVQPCRLVALVYEATA
jgi:hypothetical protein